MTWIAVDWGTSRLRAWRMGGGENEARASDDGMGGLTREGFEPALIRLLADWLDGPVEVLACGMVGARQGWAEVPYAAVPAAPGDLRPQGIATQDPRLTVRIVPGLKQAAPPDVMRGEETQIAGFLAEAPGFDGVLCLPGTHTKWVQVSAGEVVSFRTAMTGELFDLLAGGSVLRHAVGGDRIAPAAFEAGVGDALSRPEGLAQALFGIRARNLLEGAEAAEGRGRLSGLLIGADLAAARPYWLGQRIAVVGAPALSDLYVRALAAQGAAAERADADAMTRAGLSRLRQVEVA